MIFIMNLDFFVKQHSSLWTLYLLAHEMYLIMSASNEVESFLADESQQKFIYM